MKLIFLFLCAVVLMGLTQAASIDEFFHSDRLPVSNNNGRNLDDGIFITRIDHTRPTDTRTVEFVSYETL